MESNAEATYLKILNSARIKLQEVTQSLPPLEKELECLKLSGPQVGEIAELEQKLKELRERIGLQGAVDTLTSMERVVGQSVAKAGYTFEDAAEMVVQEHIVQKLLHHTVPVSSSGGLKSTPRAIVSTSGQTEQVFVLRNVTLGMAAGEMDYVVVKRSSSCTSQTLRNIIESVSSCIRSIVYQSLQSSHCLRLQYAKIAL